MPDLSRTCSRPDCDKPYRAKGLCVTHYNHAHQPQRHAYHPTPCTICGTVVLRQRRNDLRRVCSVDCRTLLEWGAIPILSSYDWTECGMQRARKAGATVIERIDRLVVFERDQWMCHYCGEQTDRTASPFDSKSPTVDHVVPLSAGGNHTWDNVRCAHLGCNSRKGARAAA